MGVGLGARSFIAPLMAESMRRREGDRQRGCAGTFRAGFARDCALNDARRSGRADGGGNSPLPAAKNRNCRKRSESSYGIETTPRVNTMNAPWRLTAELSADDRGRGHAGRCPGARTARKLLRSGEIAHGPGYKVYAIRWRVFDPRQPIRMGWWQRDYCSNPKLRRWPA